MAPCRFGARVAVLLAAYVALFAVDARASVSIAVTWDGLLRESTAAVVATPVEAKPVWENGRIYTYTRLRITRAVAGELAPGDDAWVRTMGGVVGKIGQLVDGEAVLAPGQSSLLFLHPGPVGAFEVTARGQGQFPVVAGDGKAPTHLVRSTAAGALVAPRLLHSQAPPRLAADVVHGRGVDDVA
ncbi:MAG: hypothetical protein ACRELB_09720, partial [Polyangiaceae bacterium]